MKPKPRKHPQLWQNYLWWHELVEMRKRHTLRIEAIKSGRSNLDAELELRILEKLNIDRLIDNAKEDMINCGEQVGAIWAWATAIKGLRSGGLLSQLLAQIDDIGLFDNVSKLWRFAGWAVVNGRAETRSPGSTSPFNGRLKGVCWNIADQFIKQQTPVYSGIYYAEKERQRELHPHVMCRNCDIPWSGDCQKKKHKRMFNDGHIHNRAIRKMIKVFLQHLWIEWRKLEGLPTNKPYIEAIGGHSNIIQPDA